MTVPQLLRLLPHEFSVPRALCFGWRHGPVFHAPERGRRVPQGRLEAEAASTKQGPAHWPEARGSPGLWAGRSHWPGGREHRTVLGTGRQLVIKDSVPPSSQCLGSNDPFQMTSAQHFPFPLISFRAPEWLQLDRWCHFHFTNKAGAELTRDTPSTGRARQAVAGLWVGELLAQD